MKIFVFVLIIIVGAIYFLPRELNESEWAKRVNSADRKSLYAPHYRDGKFFNPWMPVEEGRDKLSALKWFLSFKTGYSDEEKSFRPKVHKISVDEIKKASDKDYILWIGHASVLLHLSGKYFLIDPVFQEKVFLWDRKIPLPIESHELMNVTQKFHVIISHNHSDHLDTQTLEKLPKRSIIYAPLKMKQYFKEHFKGDKVLEMDWWQEHEIDEGFKIVCLPSQHWSMRGFVGKNKSLWAGFLIITPKRTIYYSSDSGYFIGFREIGRKYPNIDYALMAINAYHPRWFMYYPHMNMSEAITAFKEVGAKYYVPIQWGAFEFGNEPIGYPLLDLKRIIKEKKLDESRFVVPEIGKIKFLEN